MLSATASGASCSQNRKTVPQRAPLIRFAFEAYATGEHTLASLTEELVARGLTTVPTARLAEQPVSVRQTHHILTNTFYTG